MGDFCLLLWDVGCGMWVVGAVVEAVVEAVVGAIDTTLNPDTN
jgi:hypothetical protein